MSSVPQSAPASRAPVPPVRPVRHGTCRLELVVNGRRYSLRRGRPISLGSKMWVLTHGPDSPRAGVAHVVTRYRGTVSCSCEDLMLRGAVCKHMRALAAAGVINRRLRPEPKLVRTGPPASPAPKGGA